MRILRKGLALLLVPALLAGCVAGQSLQTSYEKPAAAAAVAKEGSSVMIAVSDDRPYVKSGDKPPHYLGKYRAGFGNPWDVSTENDEPLASILARDLSTDLVALGHAVKTESPADRRLALSIRDWNLDGYQNGRLWYDLQVTVSDAAGTAIANSTIQDKITIKGTFWMGARGGFEREMPKLYPEIVRKIVRDNPKIASALRTDTR